MHLVDFSRHQPLQFPQIAIMDTLFFELRHRLLQVSGS